MPGKTLSVTKIGFFLEKEGKYDEQAILKDHITGGVINPKPTSVGATKRRAVIQKMQAPDTNFKLEGERIKATPKAVQKKTLPNSLVTPYVYVKEVVNPKNEKEMKDYEKRHKNKNTFNVANVGRSFRKEAREERQQKINEDIEQHKKNQHNVGKSKKGQSVSKDSEKHDEDCSVDLKENALFYERNRDRRDLTYNFFQLMKDHNDLIQNTYMNDAKLNYNEVEKYLWKKFLNYEKPNAQVQDKIMHSDKDAKNTFEFFSKKKEEKEDEVKFLEKIKQLPCQVSSNHLTQDALDAVYRYSLEDPIKSKELHRRLEKAIVKKGTEHAMISMQDVLRLIPEPQFSNFSELNRMAIEVQSKDPHNKMLSAFNYLDDNKDPKESLKNLLYMSAQLSFDKSKELERAIREKIITGEVDTKKKKINKGLFNALAKKVWRDTLFAGISSKINKDHEREINVKNQENVNRKGLNIKDFKRYMYSIGIPEKKHDEEIETVYGFYCDKSNWELTKGVRKPNPKIMIRPFLYNFKKWLKENDKLSYMTTQKKTREQNNDLRIYLDSWNKNFPLFELVDFDKFLVKEVRQVTKERLPLEQYLNLSKLDFLKYHYYRIKEEWTENSKIWGMYNQQPYDLSYLESKWYEKTGKVCELLKIKKTIIKFLSTNVEDKPIMISTLQNCLMQLIRARREWFERLGELLEQYKREKIKYKETQFTLFDMANFIYDHVTDKNDNIKQFYLLNKYKKIKNKERGWDKNNALNAKELFDMKEQDLTFEHIIDCSSTVTSTIADFQDKVENYEIKNNTHDDSCRLETILHQNYMTDYILKYLKSIDKELEKPIVYTAKLYNVYVKNSLVENYIQGSQIGHIEMNHDVYIGIHEALDEEVNQNDFKDKYGNNQFQESVFQNLDPNQQLNQTLNQIEVDDRKMYNQDQNQQILQSTNQSQFQPSKMQQNINPSFMMTSAIPQNHQIQVPVNASQTQSQQVFQSMNQNAPQQVYQSMNQNAPQQVYQSMNQNASQAPSRFQKFDENPGLLPPSMDPNNFSYINRNNFSEGLPQEILHNTGGTVDIKNSINTYMGLVTNKGEEPMHFDKMTAAAGGLSHKYHTVYPIEYYANVIGRETKRASKEEWYNRPHHLESLTEHPFSLRDNVLDTNYRSTYQEWERDINGPIYTFDKTKKEDLLKPSEEKEYLIGQLESQLKDLKIEQRQLSKKKATGQEQGPVDFRNYDPIGNSAGLIDPEYMRKYQDSFDPKKAHQAQVKGYEAILDELRQNERNLLNNTRGDVYDEMRNPNPKWWEDKSKMFQNELRRHDNMLTRDLSQEVMLEKVKNKEIY